ncbi:MAG: opioid growth factor receptor-related protein, partial [Candidatus Sulfotelmatobacter sp.]
LRFYGFEVGYTPDIRIARAPNFEERAREWVSPFNHNYLRITRILKSLSLLGLEEEARAFLGCLSDIYSDRHQLIPPETFQYWKAAVLE